MCFQVEWVDELFLAFLGLSTEWKLTYAVISSGRGWTSFGSSICPLDESMDPENKEGWHTGFGIQREGDLIRGTVAAAAYCWDTGPVCQLEG
jgi:hypothetical protein